MPLASDLGLSPVENQEEEAQRERAIGLPKPFLPPLSPSDVYANGNTYATVTNSCNRAY